MRARFYTLINLLGLAFSLACSIVLLRYIHRELTVDVHCVHPETVAVPLAWLAIHRYTEGFVLKAPLSPWIFVAALLLVAVISLGTVWWQVGKAARVNPLDVMKAE